MKREDDSLKMAKKQLLQLLLEQEHFSAERNTASKLSQKPVQANPWVLCLQPKIKVSLRLLCLPYAGGNISTYSTWADHFPDEVEVYLVQLPGRGSRFNEPLYRHISLLIPALAQGILSVLNLPFVLFGHSMGALLSFELARHLRNYYALQPEMLILSGHHAPHLTKPVKHLSTLPKKQFIEVLRNYHGTPLAFFEDNESIEAFLPILRADFSLCENYYYTHEKPFDCPIVAYGASNDPDAELADLLAWDDLTTRNVEVKVFPGGHFYIDTARDLLLQVLAKDLRRCLSVR